MRIALIAASLLSLRIAAQTIPSTDCSTIGLPRSCATFNEMIAAKDVAFKDIQDKGYITYICFEPTGDKFFSLAFSIPEDGEWSGSGNQYRAVSIHTIALFIYNAGLKDDTEYAEITWTKKAKDGEMFANKNHSGLLTTMNIARVDAAQVDISYPFINLENTKTIETISIRRSTLRFSDNRQAINPKTGKTDSRDSAGYCSAYPK